MADKEIIFKKTYKCPVCSNEFKNLTVKQGKARPDYSDIDLKQNYKNIEPLKYDIILCPRCGYASVERYFDRVSVQAQRDILKSITSSLGISFEDKDELDFEDAITRYKFALLSCQVKKVKDSEIGFLMLKFGWLYRSYARETEDTEKKVKLESQEHFYLENALNYFLKAREKENGEICGMEETTFDCLLASMAVNLRREDVASRLISALLSHPLSTKRIKDKARELKYILSEEKDEK